MLILSASAPLGAALDMSGGLQVDLDAAAAAVATDENTFYDIAATHHEWAVLTAALKQLLTKLPATVPTARMARLALQTTSCIDGEPTDASKRAERRR